MLTPLDRRILEFERGWWLHPGPKDHAVREVLGMTAADYYRRLLHLLDLPEAEASDPLTVRRLRRLRASAGRPAAGE